MTTEDKAIEIADCNTRYYGGEYDSFKECKQSALDMAQWKEQQILEWLENKLVPIDIKDAIEDFKRFMKGE